jgi:hypothetical protein
MWFAILIANRCDEKIIAQVRVFRSDTRFVNNALFFSVGDGPGPQVRAGCVTSSRKRSLERKAPCYRGGNTADRVRS